MAEKNLTAQERAAYFNMNTRRNFQPVGTITGAENSLVSFNLPKSKLLAGLRLSIAATLTATHASSTSYTPHEDAPFSFLKRVEVRLNNGFSPFAISGPALAEYNKTLRGIVPLSVAASGRGRVVQGVTSSSGGTTNAVRFLLDLPIMLNPRDPIGLILLQNEETLCTVDVSLGAVGDLAPASSGYTFAVSSISVSLMSDTFTLPASVMPDISVLKLVQERTETLINGENIIKLPTGLTYRKLGFIVYNATPARVADSGITGTLDVMFNQADVPIRIKPLELAAYNADSYGGALPQGSYVLDFSDNGIANLGGARDYVDSERLTEFWLKINAAAAGTVKIWSETLARLR